MTASLDAFLGQVRARVDEALERCLPKPPDCPPLLGEALRYCVFAGGKRLRPSLVLASADAVARRSPAAANAESAIGAATPAACAVELIHTYSLIHDDLPAMDNDSLRRGRPTLHVLYGDGIAILAGDALQAAAFALLAKEPASHDPAVVARKLRVVEVIGEAAGPNGLVGGQTIDLQAAGQAPGHHVTLDADMLRTMHQGKTGAMIRASATSGAIMAGGDEETVFTIDRFAADLGLAFQIVDDILDVEGTDHELGKTAGKDASHEKPTYPALFGLDRSRALARACADRAKQTLVDAHLQGGWLPSIVDWTVTRRH